MDTAVSGKPYPPSVHILAPNSALSFPPGVAGTAYVTQLHKLNLGLPTLTGVAVGFFCGIYSVRRRAKRKTVSNGLNVDLSYTAAMGLLRSAPYWIPGDEQDGVQWFSRVIGDLWPYYEPLLCEMVSLGARGASVVDLVGAG